MQKLDSALIGSGNLCRVKVYRKGSAGNTVRSMWRAFHKWLSGGWKIRVELKVRRREGRFTALRNEEEINHKLNNRWLKELLAAGMAQFARYPLRGIDLDEIK